MMIKKTIISSFISIFLCISLVCSLCVSATTPTSQDLYDNTIFQDNFNMELGEAILADLISEYISDTLEDIESEVRGDPLDSPFAQKTFDIVNDYLDSIYMPDVTYICGKTRLTWRDSEGFHHYMRATVELYAAPNYKIDVNKLKWIDVGGGYYYPVNCLVYTIYHHDGTNAKYFVPRRSDSSTMYYLNTTLNDDNDYIAINSNGWASVAYNLYDQKRFTQVSGFERLNYENRIYWNTLNNIDFPIDSNDNMLNIKWGTNDGYPSDLAFVNGSVSYTLPDSSYVNTTLIQWWTSYVVTNSPTTNNQLTTSLTAPNQKNWYYEDNITNNTVTNNNSNDLYDGCFNSIFNVDLDDIDITTLIPTIMADLEPTLNAGIAGLLDALLDFFGDMPDFDLTWDSDTHNDYYEIIDNENYPPTTTGDINIVVTVEIERPLVSSITYTKSVELNTLPEVSTYQVPSYVLDTAPDVWELVGDVLNQTGLIPIFGFLTLAGVAIAIIFKGV